MSEPEVIFEQQGRAGFITLDRPRVLNALTLDMIRRIHRQLAAWAADPAIGHVAIRANGERAFCAGGDVRALVAPGRARSPQFASFYHEEYRLNTYIKRYPKPYLALVDGLVMGGGVGVSLHGSHRVAGDRMAFAMPETGIGLFPDIGATFLLTRLPGLVGTYLGLTGARVGATDALWAGIATHHVPSDRIADLMTALASAPDIDHCLAGFATELADAPLARRRDEIDRLFAGPSLAAIMAALAAAAAAGSAFAAATLAELATKSPTSLAITFRQLREGRGLSFEQAMRLEYRIASRIPLGGDFFEGIRAIVIDKDKAPRWQPARLAEVTPAMIDRYFAPLEHELDLADLATAVSG